MDDASLLITEMMSSGDCGKACHSGHLILTSPANEQPQAEFGNWHHQLKV
jgi:hypothetical protein